MRGLLALVILPIGALRPSSTPRVPTTRRSTATLDAVGEFRKAAGFARPRDVYWNNLELVDALSTKTFAKMPAFVSEKTIKECSKGAMEAFEHQGGHDGMYLNKPWKNSRIYYDARRVWTPEDASFWEPLVREVRQNIAQAFGLGDDLEKALPLEAAFVNYYVGLPGQPRDMERHVDCDPDGVPVPLSVVVQGIYENGDWGDVLGTLDCQKTFESDVEAVDLRAGDAAVLARAVHRPRPVPENEKRMAFVLFFSELNPTS